MDPSQAGNPSPQCHPPDAMCVVTAVGQIEGEAVERSLSFRVVREGDEEDETLRFDHPITGVWCKYM